jgi:hypothetical protein
LVIGNDGKPKASKKYYRFPRRVGGFNPEIRCWLRSELEFSQSIAQRKVLSIGTFVAVKPGPVKLISPGRASFFLRFSNR